MPAWSDLSLNDVLTGLWWLVVGVLGWLGALVGTRRASAQKPTPGQTVEVAGALIDTSRMDGLIAALDLNTVALTAKKVALERNTSGLEAAVDALVAQRRFLERNTEAAEKLAQRADDLEAAFVSLEREVIRGQRRD